jgi:hypothetical protein
MKRPKKSLFDRVKKWGGILFLVCLVITCNLSNHVDSFKCDIVHGNDHLPSYSGTKEEAIHRKTFVCDIKPPTNPFKISDSHIITIEKGWIEQSWRDGFWYETTTKDTGKDISYHIVLQGHGFKGDLPGWAIMNNQKNGWGQVMLQYYGGYLTGHLDSLPSSDTLRYTVLKKDTFNFNPENIEGTLVLVLQRHKK